MIQIVFIYAPWLITMWPPFLLRSWMVVVVGDFCVLHCSIYFRKGKLPFNCAPRLRPAFVTGILLWSRLLLLLIIMHYYVVRNFFN